MAGRPRVAVVGGYGVGLTLRADRLPEPGETLVGREFRSSHGGKGSNQAIAAARLGAEVALLSAVGADGWGQAARDLWRVEGVDAATVPTVDAATMVGVILVEPGGENRILIALGALDHLGAWDVQRFEPAIAAADVLLVSLEVPLDVAVRACAFGRSRERLVILNPAPAMSLPADLLRTVDLLVPNRSEAARLAGLPTDSSPVRLIEALLALAHGDVVLTIGGDGALLGGPGRPHLHVPAPAVPVLDTTGAGDAFCGALAVALAQGLGLEAAVRLAVRAGAHAVTIEAAVPALPRLADLGLRAARGPRPSRGSLRP